MNSKSKNLPTTRNKMMGYIMAYFKFLYSLSGRCVYYLRWMAYNYGFHIIVLLGMYKTYDRINLMKNELKFSLKKGGAVGN